MKPTTSTLLFEGNYFGKDGKGQKEYFTWKGFLWAIVILTDEVVKIESLN